MNRAQQIISIIECECDKRKHTCPHCGKDFEEDNSQHVMHNAKMDEPPYVPDDKETSDDVTDEIGFRRQLGNDLHPFKVQK